MGTVKSPYKQSDLTRIAKGVQNAGLTVSRIEVDPVSGKVVVFTSEDTAGGVNPCDRLFD